MKKVVFYLFLAFTFCLLQSCDNDSNSELEVIPEIEFEQSSLFFDFVASSETVKLFNEGTKKPLSYNDWYITSVDAGTVDWDVIHAIEFLPKEGSEGSLVEGDWFSVQKTKDGYLTVKMEENNDSLRRVLHIRIKADGFSGQNWFSVDQQSKYEEGATYLNGDVTEDPIEVTDNIPLLPSKIVYKHDICPLSYITTTYFEYDNMNRPVRQIDTTWVGDIEQMDIYDQSKSSYSYEEGIITKETTYIPYLSDIEGANGVESTRAIYYIQNGLKAEVRIDDWSDKIALDDKGFPESSSFYTYAYTERGNIKQKIDINGTTKISYDGYNAVYKHINIPVWLKVYLRYDFYNNSLKTYVNTRSPEVYMLLSEREIEYNVEGYPVKILDKPAPGWIGLSASSTTIEYIKAK